MAIFLATMAFVVGGYVLVNRRTLEAADVARSRLRAGDGGPERTWRLLKEEKISDVPFLNRLLSGQSWVDAIGVQLMRAGSELKPVTFLMIILVSGLLGTIIGGRVSGIGAFFFMAAGWLGPFLWLRRTQKKRVRDF